MLCCKYEDYAEEGREPVAVCCGCPTMLLRALAVAVHRAMLDRNRLAWAE